jgi:hypothetical protein
LATQSHATFQSLAKTRHPTTNKTAKPKHPTPPTSRNRKRQTCILLRQLGSIRPSHPLKKEGETNKNIATSWFSTHACATNSHKIDICAVPHSKPTKEKCCQRNVNLFFYFTKHASFLVASRQNIPLKPIKNTPKREKSLRARAHFSPFWGYLLCFCLSILRKTALNWRSQKQEKACFFILFTLRFAAFHLAFCRR